MSQIFIFRLLFRDNILTGRIADRLSFPIVGDYYKLGIFRIEERNTNEKVFSSNTYPWNVVNCKLLRHYLFSYFKELLILFDYECFTEIIGN